MFEGSDIIYKGMYLVGFALMMIYSILKCKKHNISRQRAITMTLFTYAAGVGGALIMGKVFTLISTHFGLGQTSSVAIFGAVMFTPLFLLLGFIISEKLFMMVKKSCWRDNIDLLTPGIFIILTCAKFGCMFAGCCQGFLCDSFGIYNPILEAKVFPIQIFEVITMILVLVLCHFLLKKYHIFPRGSAYPLTASVYSTTRFCWEFARYYESDKLRHLFFGLTLWQICCIIVIIVSIVIILYLRSPKQKKRDYFNSLSKKEQKKYKNKTSNM